ncbi:unnamed protein product [Cuscuta epithymum]|uniref:Pentatricopeptide repeat-containing protein n=1 Tax=Cuscuta epithymum TaxID=186058 RepID=A0AAV0F5L6_9ASTE|nr:unnamed protein product [Cuscuta epithymum]
MIKVLSESGCTSSVYPILDEMIKNKLWPKGTTFRYCLVGFLKEEKDTDIRKVWDIMSRHFASPGTVDLYVSMIDFYFKFKKPEEAKALFDEILSTDLKPNAYSHLIHVVCEEGDMEAAKSVFEKMVSSYINSKNRLFSLISDGGDREDTAKITYECMEKIWVPNFLTMKMLVDGLVSISKVREANEIIAHLKRMFPRNADKWIEIGEGLPKKYYDEIKPWDLMPNWFSYADITYPTLFRNKTA